MEGTMTVQLFQILLNGGSFAALLYLILVQNPKQEKEHRSEIVRVQDEHRVELVRIQQGEREAFAELLKAMKAESSGAFKALVVEYREGRQEYLASLREMTTVYRQEASDERVSCEKHFSSLAVAMSKGNDALTRSNEATVQSVRALADQQQAHALRNQQWVEVVTNAIRELESSKAKAAGT